jgi:biopolymer transport protein ExbD
MAMATLRGRGGCQSEINVTPLIDVCLVLLVIFMVVTPMMTAKSGVDLPTAGAAAKGERREEPLLASVDRFGTVRLDGETLAQGQAVARLRESLRAGSTAGLLVEADRSLTFGQVLPLLQASNEAGFRGAALAASPRKEAGK